ncbi:MAG TPA: kelch repeat-containing protein [Candidatus Hydrogenedentes bacterium]|nr:kelch repeat-containing protein [Candidatus Hydrogenedentota bacterium]
MKSPGAIIPANKIPVLFLMALFGAMSFSAAQEYAPQKENELPLLLHISWSRGPDLPQGFQDSAGGVAGKYILTACGFCAGHNNDKKPGKYPRGFLQKTWALDLTNESKGWQNLPEFPGVARQGLVGLPVGSALYCWGGFNYSEPYCYSDGYQLAQENGTWRWERFPDLPWPISGGMACTIGTTIYVCGGADYDSEHFYTRQDRKGGCERMGARLIAFDTQHAGQGWKRLPECPGTPRWVGAMTSVKGQIYLFGGATGDPYSTVVDNWKFDPAKNEWSRLRDLPIASGNFPSGKIVFKDHYILLCGGYQYAQVANPDGSTRPPYGAPRRFHNTGDYYNDMFVYDAETGLFGRADSMPLNNNLSLTFVHEDTVYMIGGETGGAEVEGVFYGHHPELLLKGRISIVETPPR